MYVWFERFDVLFEHARTLKFFHITIVGIKAQNDMLGLRLLSRKAELSKEKQVVIRSLQ